VVGVTTIEVQLPESLLLNSGQSKDDLQKRSQFSPGRLVTIVTELVLVCHAMGKNCGVALD
jgi:hypothetical protein